MTCPNNPGRGTLGYGPSLPITSDLQQAEITSPGEFLGGPLQISGSQVASFQAWALEAAMASHAYLSADFGFIQELLIS
eukprot:CAMPEP_0113722608 /NCGR_PEP_ID=MMETSP0038_2-20120614/37855_1 /TAXON_ID=2898 /ORGANISM="Cryptomonas paramecium" /LENGTH=78 /DNA_ID=CAMNT_0000651891 /DNA_START=6 /DNA_END=242 /DNA_ORIENTATION=- /assembly_acc=CAM_ASM_000170